MSPLNTAVVCPRSYSVTRPWLPVLCTPTAGIGPPSPAPPRSPVTADRHACICPFVGSALYLGCLRPLLPSFIQSFSHSSNISRVLTITPGAVLGAEHRAADKQTKSFASWSSQEPSQSSVSSFTPRLAVPSAAVDTHLLLCCMGRQSVPHAHTHVSRPGPRALEGGDLVLLIFISPAAHPRAQTLVGVGSILRAQVSPGDTEHKAKPR